MNRVTRFTCASLRRSSRIPNMIQLRHHQSPTSHGRGGFMDKSLCAHDEFIYKHNRRRISSCHRMASAAHDSDTSSTSAKEEDKKVDNTSSSTPSLFDDPSLLILEEALKKVPEHGWSDAALAAGATSLGYPAIAHGMFSRGAIELVEYFSKKINEKWLEELTKRRDEIRNLPSAKERLHLGIKLRLSLLAPYVGEWPQALSLGLLPQNLESTAKSLALITDELCHHSGHGAVDLDWYKHRATVGSVYVATELFLLTDYSEGNHDTWEFLNRRLQDMESLSLAPTNVQEGVLAFNTAVGAVASAVASLAQPSVMKAIQKTTFSNVLVTVLQTTLANVAAMAPAPAPATDSFKHTTTAASKPNATPVYPSSKEEDPYSTSETNNTKK